MDPYQQVPRSLDLAPRLSRQVRMAWLGLVGAIVVSLVLGVPLSFVGDSSSRAWEPFDMLLAAGAIMIFAIPIAGVVIVVMQRYAKLFRTGRCVAGVVEAVQRGGSILHVNVGVGPDRTFLPRVQLPVGQRHWVIVGEAMSSLALTVVDGDVRRGSLLTADQAATMLRNASSAPR